MSVVEEKRTEKMADDFLCSSNYGTSTSLLKKLEAHDSPPKKMIDKIATHWKENDQITGCTGIPRRMDAFFSHHARNELAEKIRK